MILYDPTENRAGTRLPDAIRAAGREMAGLEALTAADLLITSDGFYMPEVSEEMPGALVEAFAESVRTGILIQRKSGRDLISSLPELNRILTTMQAWSPQPWLVSTGEIRERGGYVVSEGMKTKTHYVSYVAKMTAWQRSGGYWLPLESDDHLTGWIKGWEEGWLADSGSKTVEMVRRTERSLVPAGWWERLTVIPGIGIKTAEAIGEWLPEGHRNMITVLSYLSNYEGNYRKDDHPVGVGAGTFEAVRAWLMLRPGYQLVEGEIPDGE